MTFSIDPLLKLPNVVAADYSSILDSIIIKLRLINDGINCPNCNTYISKVHQTRPILIRDLAVFGQQVYLNVPRRQFYCPGCKTSPTEPLSWLNKKQRQTTRYQEYIYERVKELTVKQVSENEKMSEDAVQDIFTKIANSKKKDWGFPKRLSLDEFARKKGKGKFVTIITDLDKSSLLELVDSHKSDDIISVLKQQPLGMREAVEEVCVDMWGGFPKVIREVFPNAKIVIDRFHVQKLVNKSLNKIRLNLSLKGLKNKFLLTSNKINLTLEEQTELELLLQASPCLRIAHELKEELITIYNSQITSRGAMRQINKWLKIARIMFGNATDTIDSHLEGICNYFNNRTTSGVTEGINTKIKLIIRQSYGFKNFNLMKQKLLACLFK
jgi:transposase